MVRWLWVIDVEMAKMNEIFVGVKEIGYIETQISKLCEKYNSRNGVDYIQQRALIVDMLCELKDIARTMVPIKDLPSCKKLTELSAEDIVSKAKDLVKNDFVKAAVGVYLLGSKINDVVTIGDVKGYYSERLAQLNSEIRTKGRSISPIEQFLLDKFNAEIGYCNIALFKAGIGAAEELKGLVEIGMKHIEKYEKEYRGNGRSEEMYL